MDCEFVSDPVVEENAFVEQTACLYSQVGWLADVSASVWMHFRCFVFMREIGRTIGRPISWGQIALFWKSATRCGPTDSSLAVVDYRSRFTRQLSFLSGNLFDMVWWLAHNRIGLREMGSCLSTWIAVCGGVLKGLVHWSEDFVYRVRFWMQNSTRVGRIQISPQA
jgi:hypothetical protein